MPISESTKRFKKSLNELNISMIYSTLYSIPIEPYKTLNIVLLKDFNNDKVSGRYDGNSIDYKQGERLNITKYRNKIMIGKFHTGNRNGSEIKYPEKFIENVDFYFYETNINK